MRIRPSLAILLMGCMLAACATSAPTPTATPRPTATSSPTATPTPEPTATATPVPIPEILPTIGLGINGIIDEAAARLFVHSVLPNLSQLTGLKPDEVAEGKVLPVQQEINALIFFRGENLWHFRETGNGSGFEFVMYQSISTEGLNEFPGNPGEPTILKNSAGETVYEVNYIGIGGIVRLGDIKQNSEVLAWQLNDHFLPIKSMFDHKKLVSGLIAVENPADLTIQIQRIGTGEIMAVYNPITGKWDKENSSIWTPEPTATPEIRPVKMGAIVIEDQSARMDIKWKDENSMTKVKEAFLIMWARKAGTTPEVLKAKMAKGEKVTGFVTYIVLDSEGKGTNTVTQKIDLSKPVKIVAWDNPIGLGSGGSVRIQFSVSNESLTVSFYLADDFIRDMSSISALREAMQQLFNNGKPVFESDPNFQQAKALDNEVRRFLIDESTGERIPEIRTVSPK